MVCLAINIKPGGRTTHAYPDAPSLVAICLHRWALYSRKGEHTITLAINLVGTFPSIKANHFALSNQCLTISLKDDVPAFYLRIYFGEGKAWDDIIPYNRVTQCCSTMSTPSRRTTCILSDMVLSFSRDYLLLIWFFCEPNQYSWFSVGSINYSTPIQASEPLAFI